MSRRVPGSPLDWDGGWGRRNESLLMVTDGTRWSDRLAIALGCLALTVIFWLISGLPGILAAAITIAVWYALGAPFAIAAGVVLMGATGVETMSASVLVTLALVGILLASAPVSPTPVRYLLVTGVLAAVIGGLTLLVASVTELWLVATGLLVGIALATFGLHRYQLLVLGLLEEDTSSVPNPDGEAAVADQNPGDRSGLMADERTMEDSAETRSDEHADRRR